VPSQKISLHPDYLNIAGIATFDVLGIAFANIIFY
jgi:hypothetical protein